MKAKDVIYGSVFGGGGSGGGGGGDCKVLVVPIERTEDTDMPMFSVSWNDISTAMQAGYVVIGREDFSSGGDVSVLDYSVVSVFGQDGMYGLGVVSYDDGVQENFFMANTPNDKPTFTIT